MTGASTATADPIRLTIATHDYDRIRALKDGTVEPHGVSLDYLTLPIEQILSRQIHEQPFDVSEMSFAAHLAMLAWSPPPFVGTPVFLSRYFRHSMVYVNNDAGIECPEDLRGKRVGLPAWWVTAVVLLKGIWHEHYGVAPEEITWVIGQLDNPGVAAWPDFGVPGDVSVEPVPPGTTLDRMLEAGQIDALFAARDPECVGRGSNRVRRLFADPKAVEIAYFNATGIFPIMHLVVVKRTVHQRHPAVARALFEAFDRAKAVAAEALHDTSALRLMVPWLRAEVEECKQIMGPDPFAYGLQANRTAIETFARYCHQQGLTPRPYSADEIFADAPFA